MVCCNLLVQTQQAAIAEGCTTNTQFTFPGIMHWLLMLLLICTKVMFQFGSLVRLVGNMAILSCGDCPCTGAGGVLCVGV